MAFDDGTRFARVFDEESGQHVRAGCLIEQEATETTERTCISLFSLFDGIYMHPLFLKAFGLTSRYDCQQSLRRPT